MKAVTIARYGGPEVLAFTEVPAPTVEDDHVLVKVHASCVNPIDWKIRGGALKMFIRAPLPMILGVDLAGEVVEVGRGVQGVSVGDPVFAMMPGDIGAQAEIVKVPSFAVAKKPSNMSMAEAASVPSSALTALQALRDLARLKAGQHVLINGASGGVGLFAVQTAKALGLRVTAVCGTAGFDLVKGLGADRLIDYKATDFTAEPEQFDAVLDVVANRSPHECKRVVVPGGAYVNTGGSPWLFLRQLLNFAFSMKVYPIIVRSHAADLEHVRSLIEEGKVRTVIDRVYPIEAIAEAHKYSATGRAKGKIVVNFA